MNPFETGMVNFESGFASVPTRILAERHSAEELQGTQRFSNPTWSRLGREVPQPPGTYYFGSVSKPLNIFWHHLDQVLVRPALFEAFPDEEFHILTSIPGPDGSPVDLIRSTRKHWALVYSDHLPILLKLDLKLTEITGGLVEGVVKESAEAGTVYASLYAGVPAVGDYQFKILYVAHPVVVDPANPFPITVEDSFGHEKRKFLDMPSFDQYLRDLLLFAPVRTAIGNLIKYSKSRAAS